MKKTILSLLVITIFCGALAINAVGQGIAATPGKKEANGIHFENNGRENIKWEQVNVKAVRNFLKTCQDADDIKWYKTRDGFMVYYYRDGNKNIRGYDEGGNWVSNMVTYHEDKLPTIIWHRVKSTYYECSILLVNELQLYSGTIYILHLEDKNSFKNVMINGDEMDLVETIKKI